jgi:hypothetical protein
MLCPSCNSENLSDAAFCNEWEVQISLSPPQSPVVRAFNASTSILSANTRELSTACHRRARAT